MFWGVKKRQALFLAVLCLAGVFSFTGIAKAGSIGVTDSTGFGHFARVLFVKSNGSLWGWDGESAPERLFSTEQFKTVSKTSGSDSLAIKNDGTTWSVRYVCEEKITETQKISSSGQPYSVKNREWVDCRYTLKPYKPWNDNQPEFNNHTARWQEAYLNSGHDTGITTRNEWMIWGRLAGLNATLSTIPVNAPLEGAFHSPITIAKSRLERGNACAIWQKDGSLWCFGTSKHFLGSGDSDFNKPADDPEFPLGKLADCGGLNVSIIASINDCATAIFPKPVATSDTIAKVNVAGKFVQLSTVEDDKKACALRDDGAVWCWGYSRTGFGPNYPNNSYKAPVQLPGEYSYISTSILALDKIGRPVYLFPSNQADYGNNTPIFPMGGFVEITAVQHIVGTAKRSELNLGIAQHNDGSIWYFNLYGKPHSFTQIENFNLNIP